MAFGGRRGTGNRPGDPLFDALVAELEGVVGRTDVDLAEAGRVAYARDFWPLAAAWFVQGRLPSLPDVVVWPDSPAEVAGVLRLADKHGMPVTPYGAGSGVMGGAVAVAGGITLDLKKMDRIRRLDPQSMVVEVEAGILGQTLENQLNRLGFTCGHVPQSMYCSTLGGWIACRAAGQFSTKYGKIEDVVIGLEAVLPSGEVWRTKAVPRASTGPRLEQLLLGSEGTLAVVTAATLRVWPVPEVRVMRSYAVPGVADGLAAVRQVLQRGLRPAVVRLYDEVEAAHHFADVPAVAGRPMLVVLCEGDRRLAELEAEGFAGAVGPDALATGAGPVEHWLETRFDVSLSSYLIRAGGLFETIEVSSLWRDALPLYEAMKRAIQAVPGTMLVSGHWSHAYPEGVCLYLTVAAMPAGGPGAHDEYYKALWDAAMAACLENGGTISHHHGVGLVRARYLPAELGPGYEWLKRLKAAADPKGLLNPGKMGLGEVTGAGEDREAGEDQTPPATEEPGPAGGDGFDLKGVTDCAICPNMCRFDCPVTAVDQREGVSPSGKIRLAHLLKHGRIEMTPEAAGLISSCLGCRACAELCPFAGFSVADNLVALRADAAVKRALPAALAALGQDGGRGNPYGQDLEAAATELTALAAVLGAEPGGPPGRDVLADPPVLFFPGCSAIRLRPQAAQSALRLMARSGRRWTLLDPPDLCCGYAYIAAGRPDLAGRAAIRVKAAVAAAGAGAVVTGCPECAVALTRRYQAHGLDLGVPVITLTAFLKDARLEPKPPVAHRLAYHAPCVLARELGQADDAQELLRRAGFEVVEPIGAGGQATRCCGGGLFYDRVSPERSRLAAVKRLQQLRREGQEDGLPVVSACPFCEARLGAVDLAEVLDGGPAALPAGGHRP